MKFLVRLFPRLRITRLSGAGRHLFPQRMPAKLSADDCQRAIAYFKYRSPNARAVRRYQRMLRKLTVKP